MSTVRISWSGELTEEEKDVLNDIFNVMGMSAAVYEGLIPQEEVDKEVARVNAKYKLKEPN